MKGFAAQFFRLQDDRPLGQHCGSILQSQQPECPLGTRDRAEAAKLLLFGIEIRGDAAFRERESHGNPFFSKIPRSFRTSFLGMAVVLLSRQ
jgi:hypothetical protein